MKKRMSRRSSAKKNSPSSNHSSNPESSDERGVSVSLAPGQELQGYDSSPSTPLQPQDSQLTAVAAKFDKFTLFPKLPAELRLKIWRSAIGCTSNIIKLDLDISPHFISWSCEKERSTDERKLRGVMRDFNEIVLKYNLTCKDAPNDVLLGVCVESRTEALKRMKSYIQLRREPQGKTWTHPGTAVVDLESEKIWFNPATDTIYLDKRSTFVLSTMNLGYSALRRRLHNFDKIKTVGVDEFDIRTKGLELLMRHFFHGASKVVPIRDKDGDPAMQGLMSTGQRSWRFKNCFLEPFILAFRSLIQQSKQDKTKDWQREWIKICNELYSLEDGACMSLTWSDRRCAVGSRILYY
ncbi:hypothetical protein ACEPPN_018723 [Leptodophora sp. 'Broadleaf-Isolate-01']